MTGPAPVVPRGAPPGRLPQPPRPAVVEFADEVVEVRKPAPPTPTPASRPGSAAAPVLAPASRILQFQKQQGGGGLLGDDLSQMSSGTRSLVYAVVLLLAAGIVWGIVTLMR